MGDKEVEASTEGRGETTLNKKPDIYSRCSTQVLMRTKATLPSLVGLSIHPNNNKEVSLKEEATHRSRRAMLLPSLIHQRNLSLPWPLFNSLVIIVSATRQ